MKGITWGALSSWIPPGFTAAAMVGGWAGRCTGCEARFFVVSSCRGWDSQADNLTVVRSFVDVSEAKDFSRWVEVLFICLLSRWVKHRSGDDEQHWHEDEEEVAQRRP